MVGMKKVYDRIEKLWTEPLSEEASHDLRRAMTNWKALGKEMAESEIGEAGMMAASYMDEKMSKMIESVCEAAEEQKLGGKPAFCEWGEEYAEEQREARTGF